MVETCQCRDFLTYVDTIIHVSTLFVTRTLLHFKISYIYAFITRGFGFHALLVITKKFTKHSYNVSTDQDSISSLTLITNFILL